MTLPTWLDNPAFGIGLTLLVYCAAVWARSKRRGVNPLVVASLFLIAFLSLTGISYESYRAGGDWIAYGLGPATVALAVPLYKHAAAIRRMLGPVLLGIIAGSILSLTVVMLLLYIPGSPRELLLSMLTKSVSSPIALEITKRTGGIPELSAVFSVLSGLFGSIAGPLFMRLCGIRGDILLCVGIGTSSHGIGTARVLLDSEWAGGVSGFSMAAAGIATSILMIPIYGWL
ncbi:LrgB family protein [Cohnella sp. LGH]|uniref:LrgB family protein n=1 Tax=Cohnella sp. LGH TaxID=1619153 RepID=UPI001ADB3885|nr:LrgB family protein [Cohnella sp. LGH]QTH41892.1 LrgB family protein [Cohnella sp. LGH]